MRIHVVVTAANAAEAAAEKTQARTSGGGTRGGGTRAMGLGAVGLGAVGLVAVHISTASVQSNPLTDLLTALTAAIPTQCLALQDAVRTGEWEDG